MKHRCFWSSGYLMVVKFNSFLWILVLNFVSFNTISGQVEITNARSKALGDQGIVLNDLEGFIYNSSALAQLKNSSVLVTAENRFIGTGIKGVSLQAALKAGSNNAFGFNIEQYGIKEYSQQIYRFGYGRKLSDRFFIGASFSFKTFVIPGVENSSSLLLDLGATYRFSEKFVLGISSFNPFIKSMNSKGERKIHTLGIQYQISSWVALYGQFEKENRLNWTSKYGLEYKIKPQFSIRIGVKSDATKFHLGFGLIPNPKFNIDFAVALHTALGLTPALSLRYNFIPSKLISENL